MDKSVIKRLRNLEGKVKPSSSYHDKRARIVMDLLKELKENRGLDNELTRPSSAEENAQWIEEMKAELRCENR